MVKKCKSLLCAVLLLSGCDSGQQQLTLNFSLQNLPGSVHQVAFFIYDLALIDTDNQPQPIVLDSIQHPDQVALISLSSTQSGALLQASVDGSSEFKGLEFTLGVPETLNHANPLQARAPLNNSQMFWSWQQGYKFLRIDGQYNSAWNKMAGDAQLPAENGQWAFHLGSTGCVSPSALQPPTQPCSNDHRVRVRLSGFDPEKNHIAVDLSVLQTLASSNDSSSDKKIQCTEAYTEQPVCMQLLAVLGLNVQTGTCVENCAAQGLFYSR